MQNPLVDFVKIIVGTAFAVVLGLVFLQYHSMEEKIIRAGDQVATLESTITDLKRRIDEVSTDARDARDASRDTRQHVDSLVDTWERLPRIATTERAQDDNAGQSRPARSERPDAERRGDRNSQPSIITGIEVYPYNKGYTVLAAAEANVDPNRELPADDQIDWDATLMDYIPGEPKGLNFYSDDRTGTLANISHYVHDSLANRKDVNMQEWSASLAERIEESPDRRVYMIYLRKGIRWHDPAPDMLRGQPWLKGEHLVTAEDVKFTYDILRNPQTSTPMTVYFEKIESVEIVDDYTVRVTWQKPNFYARGSTLELQPLPKFIWGSDPDGNPYPESDVYAQFSKHWFGKSMCGNGPYRFVEYRRGELIRLVRNNGYHGQRATCREYHIQIIRDNTARLARFWNNGLATMILPAEQYRNLILEGLEDRPIYKFDSIDQPPPADWKYTYKIWRRPMYAGFGWNMRRSPFDDKRVRKALTLALNRPAVPDKIFYGLGELVAIGESVFSPYFNADIEPLPFDLEEAARQLEAAGWIDTDEDGIRDREVNGAKANLEFELLISSASPEQRAICQMYKQDLLKIGAKLEINPAEGALWSRKIHDRDFDGFIIFWSAGFDSDPRQLWDSSKANDIASNNYTGFANAEADEIFARLEQTFDYPERTRMYKRWYEIEFDEQPYTWIWSIHSPLLSQADWRIPEPRLGTPKIDRRLMFRWKTR